VPFEEAPFGVTGLETAFAALYTYLSSRGLLTLETLLERMSAGRPGAYGVPAAHRRGAPANLVLLDANAMWQVTDAASVALGELVLLGSAERSGQGNCRGGKARLR